LSVANGAICRQWASGVTGSPGNILLCDDDDLDYRASRTRFTPGAGFALDEAYRLSHLPLVAPQHPKVIARKAGAAYEMGRHGKALSLVLPVPDIDHVLEPALKAAPFASKIAWDIAERRRGKLHATLCGRPRIDRAALG
jgi:hypothetical protein